MYILLGIILVIIGLVMLIKPEIVFEITESWKHSSDTEPSDFYKLETRIGGAVLLIVGAAGSIILLFL